MTIAMRADHVEAYQPSPSSIMALSIFASTPHRWEFVSTD